MHFIWVMADTPGLEQFKDLLAEGGLPELGPGPRPGILPHAVLTEKLDALLAATSLPSVSRDLIRALILLWHDRLDPAHEIAQGIENADGSFLHGIVHRREPDYGNATYWFRRVHDHPCYPKLARRVEALPALANNPMMKSELLPRHEWDPFGFTRLCEKSSRRAPGDEQAHLLRTIQGVETEVLLEHFLGA